MTRLLAAVLAGALFLLLPTHIPPDSQQKPVPAHMQRQPKQVLASRAMQYRERIMTATAYANDPITATGTVPKRGTIAVDPQVIPLGTRLWVEGYGWGVAEDTGGAIKGEIVDVFLESEDACREWGRRKVMVRVYERVDQRQRWPAGR